MDDAAVMAALVGADPVLLLEDGDRQAREAPQGGEGGGESDDAAADDGERTAQAPRADFLDLGLWEDDQKGDSSTGLPSFPLGGGGGT